MSRTIPIFSRDWWLDAVCGESNWDVTCVNQGEDIAAALPYMITRKFGKVILGQPQQSQSLGPWTMELSGSHSAVLSKQAELLTGLIDRMPRFDSYAQNWNHRLSNWLPFYWRGFTQTTKYTYLVDLHDGQAAMDRFSSNMRNKVRKAAKCVEIDGYGGLDVLVQLTEKTFRRQGLESPYSDLIIRRMDTALAAQDRRRIAIAYDSSGIPHSALYLIWDDESAYLHMAGEDPRHRKSGAGILLIKDAIEFASGRGLKTFDFEGSMLKTVEIVRRSCGGRQTPYSRVEYTPSRVLRIGRMVRRELGL